MKLGIAIFPAEDAIRPDELARAVEERGFESLSGMPHAGMPLAQLEGRIRELRDAARAAGRDAEIPVTLQGAEADARALDELREIGVTRATLYVPSAGAEEVLRFLDDVAPLVEATNAT
jgi:hypothetical protein